MNSRLPTLCLAPTHPRVMRGFSLIELMISITLSLIVLSALVGLFVNTSRNSNEMAKTNAVIENGRFSLQLLESDLVHAGFLAGYAPQYDDVHFLSVPPAIPPTDVPTVIPDPCQPYAAWTANDVIGLIGIAVQSSDALPGSCAFGPARRAGTDVLVVRHVETCVPGSANCDPVTAGRLYFQTSNCAAHRSVAVLSANNNSIQFSGASVSTTDGAYVGMTIRIAGGIGEGQIRRITAYAGGSRTATVSPDWTTNPDASSTVSFAYLLGTNAFPLTQRNCTAANPQRQFVSNIYYVTDIAYPGRVGERIPVLVRSPLDVTGGAPAHQEPVSLIEGIENFRVELGIDDRMTRCGLNVLINNSAARNVIVPEPTCAANAANPNLNTLATNRGDGSPDRYQRCTTAAPCPVADLANVVAARIYVLVRSRDTTPGYRDTKTYCLGEPDLAGNCPAASVVPAANDAYKRHVFSSTVRFTNVSARRESP